MDDHEPDRIGCASHMMNAELLPQNSVFLAPMAGITDAPFRRLCMAQGADFTVTEMISAKGVAFSPKEREEVAHLRTVSPSERAFLQLFGSDKNHMASIAARFEDGPYLGIDINMGCPAPKIVGNGDGSAMLKDLKNAESVVRAVVCAVQKPVSVKMRMGFDENSINYLEAGQRFQDAGASFITLHARTRNEMYHGHSHWEAIAQLACALSIPVIGNGDICGAEDALQMLAQTGCRGIMVGRGAMGNPWIFTEIKAALKSEKAPLVSSAQRLQTALLQARELAKLKGENMAVREMRKHMAWYTKGMRGNARARVQINTCTSIQELEHVLNGLQNDTEIS